MADLTVKELMKKFGVGRRTANGWFDRNIFPNAKLVETPANSYWTVPESDLEGFEPQMRKGRPAKAEPSKETLAKRASRANLKTVSKSAAED